MRFKPDNEKLFGIYRGVVEDRKDPLRLGRVRVRVMGVHTEEQGGALNKVPWEELVWAHQISPVFEGSISGSGAFCVPLQGSHVMVFFENGNMMQPRYFGTVSGYPVDAAKFSQLEKQDGFKDREEVYPLADHIPEHDWQRLSRIDKLGETYLILKEENLDLAVPIAFDGTPWDEQPPMFEAEYPDNNVFSTHDDYESSMVIELDSTFGKERFAWWHPSLSYMELNWEGRLVFRNTFHRWDICDGQVIMHYMDLHFKTIDKTMTFLLKESEFREILEDRWTRIGGLDWRKVFDDVYEVLMSSEITQIADTKHHTVDVDYKELTTANKESTISGNMIKYITGNYEKYVGGDYTLTVETNMFRSIAENDEKYVAGDIKSYTEGTEHRYCDVDYLVKAEDTISINGVNEMLTYSETTNIVYSEDEVEVIGETNIHIGSPLIEIGGGLVRLGPTVLMGQPIEPTGGDEPYDPEESEYIEVAEPAPPELPIEPLDPPPPHIPPKFPLKDVPIEMPKPGC